MKLAPGYWLTIGLCAPTVFLWTRAETFPWKFVDPMSAWTSAGQLAGLIGITLFSVAMILSARVRWMEPLFGGMNRVYIAHHLIGGIAFLLLLVHPLLLTVSYLLISPQTAASFLLPGADWTINMGRTAMLLLMLLLLLTYYVELPYQLWRLTHQFLGLAFFFGGIHGLYVSSDVAREPALRWYLILLISGGFIAYIYRTLLGTLFVPRTAYTVKAIRRLKERVIEITLVPRNRAISFRPGQFVFISIADATVGRETHPFSISSAPDPRGMTLTVKSLGDHTTRLAHVPVGTPAWIEGPYGKFTYSAYAKRQIWVAGGIGITPFVSMARSIRSRDYMIDCYYAVKDESELVYPDEFARISASYPNFKLYPVCSSVHGRLTAKTIAQISGELQQADIFLCGPPPMMMSLKKQFRALAVPAERIHSEEFAFL